MAFYKYKISAWKSCALNCPPPPPPAGMPTKDDPSVLIGGKVMMWTELIKRTEPDRFAEIISTLDTVKRAMERPGEELLRKAERDTFVNLTTKRELPSRETQIELTGISDETFCKELRKTVQDVYKGKRYNYEQGFESFFPSTKANYLRTRGKGGAVGAVMDSEEMKTLKAKGKKLIKFRMAGKTWRSRRLVMDDSNLTEKWRQLYEQLLDGAVGEEKKVELVALAEALKVRVISKGPVKTYTVLKPLQKWLWKTLKNHESGAFKLVGEEISASYLESQLGELREDEKYLSGDYKAATDNLKPAFSDAVVDEICELCIEDKRLIKLFKESLTGHLIEDPEHPKRSNSNAGDNSWGVLHLSPSCA